jgi:excisionase family DNA binding protein
MTEPLIYRVAAVTQKLGVSRATVYRLVERGELKLVKISTRASGITADSLRAFVEKAGVQVDR